MNNNSKILFVEAPYSYGMLRKSVPSFDVLIDVLRKYNVRYILVRKHWWCDKGERFQRFPELFSLKYDKGMYSIFEVSPDKLLEYLENNS